MSTMGAQVKDVPANSRDSRTEVGVTRKAMAKDFPTIGIFLITKGEGGKGGIV